MTDRPRFFDDLAGVAGGAFSALAGVREEIGAIVRARVDEALSSLNLVRRDEFEVVRELASRARMAQEDAEARLSALESRIATLEADSGRSQDYVPPTDQPPAPFNSF
ncbi:accessory factor UbiK family protein [Gluconacetobacter tumulisoli]|uniref:Accessory factor UbiK family protein n=1 Tax=Gluconacetobacter tumulisoli TaxID=1286189 RepID=A0A7W4K992_9PROT|nr:accessory factor UbiK family protein [Gluconacetobacter tumulisoli]MBB2202709.1 accessory factor UbiK family protein [Gluconacetobacter tumulisoli]